MASFKTEYDALCEIHNNIMKLDKTATTTAFLYRTLAGGNVPKIGISRRYMPGFSNEVARTEEVNTLPVIIRRKLWRQLFRQIIFEIFGDLRSEFSEISEILRREDSPEIFHF